ncbi:MAG: hypothetical protein JHC53_00195 [Thermoleophilia bacterium]|nr:hypothetical protein [Thermoleophilia bacterium]
MDTCGAGDSFNAGVLMGIAGGNDILDACAPRAEVVAQCLTQVGPFPMPRSERAAGRPNRP